MMLIRHILQTDIDKRKWDECIRESVNGLIYGYSWYLDALQTKWDALILGDYEAVMPLTWNQKYGITYLYQPWFCASLGVFSKSKISEELVLSFLKAIPSRYKYIDIFLNTSHRVPSDEFSLSQRVNYTLSLHLPYEKIEEHYRTQLKRNLTKAITGGLIFKRSVPVEDVLMLAKETLQRVSSITDKELTLFLSLAEQVRLHESLETAGVYNANGQLLASAVFFHSHKRWYYILVGNHPNGKTLGASHLLIDRFIQLHADQQETLDFEGSEIRNIAFFYSSFGAVQVSYAGLKLNRLPALIKWLKR